MKEDKVVLYAMLNSEHTIQLCCFIANLMMFRCGTLYPTWKFRVMSQNPMNFMTLCDPHIFIYSEILCNIEFGAILCIMYYESTLQMHSTCDFPDMSSSCNISTFNRVLCNIFQEFSQSDTIRI